LQQGEFGRHQLEHHGAVFDLGAQARDARGQDAAVVVLHGSPRQAGTRSNAAARGLLDQAGFKQQLVALQHQVLVPGLAIGTKVDSYPRLPGLPQCRIWCLIDPGLQRRQDVLGQHRGGPIAPVFPGEIAVPVLPAGVALWWLLGLAGQPQVADGQHMGRLGAFAVGEGVELLDIAQAVLGLGLDPAAQTRLQRAVQHLERPGRQGLPAACGQHPGLAQADGREHRHQLGMQGVGGGLGQFRR